MKKGLLLLLILGMLLVSVSCKGTVEQGTETKPQESETVTDEQETKKSTESDTKEKDKEDELEQYKTVVKLNSETVGIKVIGERSLPSETQINCDWTCSGLEFVIDSRGGDLLLRTSTTDGCYFRVWIDGKEWKNEKGDVYYKINGVKNLTIPDIPTGEHTVKILKVTGYTLTRAHFYSLTFYGSLLTDKVPQEKDTYIEFVGDSICCGWGTIGGHTGAYTDQDGTLAYPYLVAESLNADYTVTALSGQGLLYGTPGMTKGYLYDSPLRDTATEYDFARKANMVVINIGTNDFAYKDKTNPAITEESFKDAYLAFLKTVHEKNGNDCKIYCLYNTMNDTFQKAILEACSEVGGVDAGVYTLCLDRTASGHPTIAEQKAYAEILTAYLNETKDKAITAEFGKPESKNLKTATTGEGLTVAWDDKRW